MDTECNTLSKLNQNQLLVSLVNIKYSQIYQ